MIAEYSSEVDHLVHSLFSAPGLTEASAVALARAIGNGRSFSSTPERYAKAIDWALARPDSITARLRPPYGEAEVREFFGLVRRELQRTERRT